jgi:hypothetical protein
MSKGSKQRPMDVPLDTFQENFDRIFKNKKDKKVKKDEDTERKSER